MFRIKKKKFPVLRLFYQKPLKSADALAQQFYF